MNKDLDITSLLEKWKNGDQTAFNQVIDALYDELKQCAHFQLLKEYRGSGLQTTELLNEVYVRLVGTQNAALANRKHFMNLAAKAMQRLLVDFARQKKALKYGGDFRLGFELDENTLSSGMDADEFLAFNDHLEALRAEDPILADIVIQRYYAGFTIKETSENLGIPVIQVNRKWALAKGILVRRHKQLAKEGALDSPDPNSGEESGKS